MHPVLASHKVVVARANRARSRARAASLGSVALAAVATCLATGAANAQSATAGSVVTLGEIVVEGTAGGPAAGEEAQARRRAGASAGGTAVLSIEEVAGEANASLADTLNGVPGVIANSFFGGNDQPKLHIRGSGQQSNPVERGLAMLQDGLPINSADGSYIVGLIDPRQAEFVEVFRGYTANRLGVATLGGAVNFVSPTGSQRPGVELGVEGGSNGHLVTTARAGARQGAVDAFGQVTHSRRDGYRDQSGSERFNAALNVGLKLGEGVATRAFFGYTDLAFEIPGPLSRAQMLADPQQAASGPGAGGVNPGPNAVRDRPRREAEQVRVGSRTTATFGANVLDAVVGYAWTDDSFRFPVGTGFRETAGGDLTASLRYAYAPDKAAALPLVEATALYVVGGSVRDFYVNTRGSKGALFGSNDLDAETLSLHAGANVPVGALTLSPAVAYVRTTRDNVDTFAAARRPTFNAVTGASGSQPKADTSFARSYDAVNPSFGITWALAPENLLFAAVSRSFEAPTFDDLIEATGGTPNTSPTGFFTPALRAQTATTVEGGWRGAAGPLAWDVVSYFAWIENELLRYSDGTRTETRNAGDTTHFGVEFGGRLRLTEALAARLTYTYQDFRFDGDVVYGDNRIAGAPRHTVVGALRWTVTRPWWVEAEVQWMPTDTPVDNANTLFADAYAILNLRTNYQMSERFGLFGEVRNVLDATYAASSLTVGRASRPDQAVYLPGDGRAVYGGTRVRF